jgi:hypothetical protein
MNQPYVIAKMADRNQYLSKNQGSWTWVPVGSWRSAVLSFVNLSEAEKFAEEFKRQTGIQVEAVMKWYESIDEIIDILGVQQGLPWEGRAREAIGMLWQALPEYSRAQRIERSPGR